MKVVISVLMFATLAGVAPIPAAADSGRRLPWREVGLTERQAAAHLLDRFAYGPRPGEIDVVIRLGLGNWIEGQLAGDLPGSLLTAKLSRLPAMALDHRQIVERYSHNKGYLVQQAISAGVISRADYFGENGTLRSKDAVAALERFSMSRGAQPESSVLEQLKAQKLLRAVYSESQLVEVLTAFWFNHFNVSSTANSARVHLLSYERDAIRPNVLSRFRELLGATARHPAMLTYLGNTQSVANYAATTTFDREVQELDRLSPLDNPTERSRLAHQLGWTSRSNRAKSINEPLGLNENYARELLELHTLGVDGGYGQGDVVAVARALTGWTTFPTSGGRDRLVRALASRTALEMGFVVQGEFVFRSDQHDSDPKTVFGVQLAAGRGIEDGVEVLDMLSDHPSTARHVMTKFATRFISDRPPPALVDSLVRTWELSRGDLVEAVWTLAESPEFWKSRRSKIKTPFELVASTLRAVDADVSDPVKAIHWIRRMGQPIYAYSAPTGFPDRGEAWTDVGPLLVRLNFGLEFSGGNIRGVTFDPDPYLAERRLSSLQEAITIFFPLLMPERSPLLTLDLVGAKAEMADLPKEEAIDLRSAQVAANETRSYTTQAVGILIGSPEFQVH